MSLFKILKNNIWPIVSIIGLTLIIGLLNHKAGTLLTGGDNLHPEFSPEMNIQRAIFTTWQEYQGVGLLGGMGHGADLLRQLILYPFVKLAPLFEIRYWYTISTLGIGGIGAYFFIKKILSYLKTESQELIASVGAVFYILNLSTLQSYFTAFETFTAHFAALPWLLLSFILYFEKPSKKTILFLSAVLFLATPHAYVPTLFVVYILASLVMLPFFIDWKNKKHSFWTIVKYGILVFALNAFWMLPFAYFTVTNSAVNVNAKINQMATENIFLQNREFGDILDVILLRGFWFNNVDFTLSGKNTYMLLAWREYLSNPIIASIGYLFFGVILGGIAYAVKYRNKVLLAMVALFIFSFGMIATNTPPFSWLNIVFREIPLINQVFRFPFTKFSILASLMYATFFSVGIAGLISIVKSRYKKLYVSLIVPILSLALIALFMFPVFQGKLFYEREEVKMPQEYLQLFDYFKHQNQNTRIADFPQDSFWGWYFYDWGYTGSGFLWYGIKQPIMDRAFDVWSGQNENYYYEISYALYKKDPGLLEQVLNKYQINYLLVDRHVINPLSPKSLFDSELKELIAQIPSIQKDKSFGKIDVYTVALKDKPKDFLFITSPLPKSAISQWNDFDSAYYRLNNYENANTQFNYPFTNLFSKRETVSNSELTEQKNTIKFSQTIPALPKGGTISIPSYINNESFVPAQLIAQPDVRGNTQIILRLEGVTMYVNNKNIYRQESELPLFQLPKGSAFPVVANINGTHSYTIQKPGSKTQTIPYTFVSLNQENIITLTDKSGTTYTQSIPESFFYTDQTFSESSVALSPSTKDYHVTVTVPKITDQYISLQKTAKDITQVTECSDFRNGHLNSDLSANIGNPAMRIATENSSACVSFYSPTLPHTNGYAIFTKTTNISGRGFHFWILNEDLQYAPLDIYLPTDKKTTTHGIILSPMEQFGRAYSFHVDNISIGKNTVENSFSSLSVYPIPYTFLNLLNVESNQSVNTPASTGGLPQLETTTHPQESFYTATLKNPQNAAGVLVLSQGYNSGWKAYQVPSTTGLKSVLINVFPFFYGTELTSHVKVNNWENGWELNNSTQGLTQEKIVLVYLPQYLQYGGFILLAITIIALSAYGLKKSSS